MQLPTRSSGARPSDLLGCLLHRIATLIFTASALALSISAVVAGENPSKPSVPNIVLILADDLGYAELGCYGQKWIKTPHVDELAAEGMRFTQFYSGNAVCAPARCVLMTGKHGGHASIRNNGNPRDLQHLSAKYDWEFPGQNPLPAGEVTIAEILKARGYATAAIGKWGLGHHGTSGDPNRQGFDHFFGYLCQRHAHNHYPRFLWRNSKKVRLEGNDRTLSGKHHSQDLFVKEALKFIRTHHDRPFFVYLPVAIPHLSIQTTDKWLNKYRGKIPEAEYKHRGYLKHPFPRAGYAGMVSQMDDGVGQIMRLLRELDLDQNTIVLFTSDNGPTYDRLGGSDSEFFRSAGPFRGLKGSLYEGGIRVPLVVRWPGHIPPASVSDHVCAFWDILPTLCEIANVQAPDGVDGISLLPTLNGKGEQQKHEFLYWEFPAYGGQQAVRFGDYKAVRQNMLLKDNSTPLTIELYNLSQDQGEQHDVASDHPQIVARAEKLMDTARIPSNVFPFKPLDQRVLPQEK